MKIKLVLLFIVTCLVGALGWLVLQNPANARTRPASLVQQTAASDPAGVCLTKPDTQNDGRDRAWCLFQYLVDHSGDPTWTAWTPVPLEGVENLPCPTPAAARNVILSKAQKESKLHAMIAALRPPVQLAVAGDDASAPNLLQTAGVLFNDSATHYICNSLRQSGSVMAGLNAFLSPGAGSITFPGDQYPIAVKTIWALMPDQSSLPPAERVSQIIPVWDSLSTFDPIHPTAPPRSWSTKVLVDTDTKDDCHFTAPAPGHWTPKPTASLGCFYSVLVPNNDFPNINQNAVRLFGAGVAPPYHLILLGFHVAAKVGTNWTWQTYWWSAQGFDQQGDEWDLNSRRPTLSTGTPTGWQHYVMNTSATGFDPAVLYNPYLELQLKEGSSSSCTDCHGLAVYHQTPANPQGQQTISCLFASAQNFALTMTPTPANTCPPAGTGIPTDKMWTLGDINVAGPHGGDGVATPTPTPPTPGAGPTP